MKMFSKTILLVPIFAALAIGASIKQEDHKCGMWKEGGLVKNESLDNSKKAGLGEFPWTVALIKNNVVSCAGSLIETNVVLTAGHCVKDVKKEDLKIKAGLWDLNNNNEQYLVQERMVSQIINHPEYSKENKSNNNDIALLVLDKAVDLADHIGLACLAKKDHEEKSKKCYAAGWGKESKDGKTPSVLKKMHLPIVAKEDCEKKLKEKSPSVALSDKVLCAGGDKTATCLGDGGAALVCQMEPEGDNKNRLVQSGITSWGVGCMTEFPGVYTKVSQYRDWIDEHITKLGLDKKYYTG